MIPTATVLAFFAWAYVFGLELGLCYGFLRPLRPRHTGAADLLFLLALYRKAAVLGDEIVVKRAREGMSHLVSLCNANGDVFANIELKERTQPQKYPAAGGRKT